jgi:hypothetical protein
MIAAGCAVPSNRAAPSHVRNEPIRDFVVPDADVDRFAPGVVFPGESKLKIPVRVVADLVEHVLF